MERAKLEVNSLTNRCNDASGTFKMKVVRPCGIDGQQKYYNGDEEEQKYRQTTKKNRWRQSKKLVLRSSRKNNIKKYRRAVGKTILKRRSEI